MNNGALEQTVTSARRLALRFHVRRFGLGELGGRGPAKDACDASSGPVHTPRTGPLRRSVPKPRCRGCLLALLLLACAAPLSAAGEHGRRFAAELAVMLGDAEKLLAAPTAPLHRRGLEARLESSLSLLGLLAREQAQERGTTPAALLERVAALRDGYRVGRLEPLRDGLRALVQDHPLHLPGWRQPEATPARLASGRTLYESLCQGCHHRPYQGRENPPYNLFRQARSEPRAQFAARLYGGVRGVPATSLDNPLSLEEMTALLVWFLEAPAGQTGLAEASPDPAPGTPDRGGSPRRDRPELARSR